MFMFLTTVGERSSRDDVDVLKASYGERTCARGHGGYSREQKLMYMSQRDGPALGAAYRTSMELCTYAAVSKRLTKARCFAAKVGLVAANQG